RRYRGVWRRRNRVPLRVLDWPGPGRVWAIDFTEAPNWIDGRLPYLVAVRDLATGMQLGWQPVAAATGAAAADALAGLFPGHGPPLVLHGHHRPALTPRALPAPPPPPRPHPPPP